MQLTDLTIHVNQTLGQAERTALEDELRKLDGVIAPRFNEATPHLLLVSYNPVQVESRHLLDRVKAKGYDAQLVGL